MSLQEKLILSLCLVVGPNYWFHCNGNPIEKTQPINPSTIISGLNKMLVVLELKNFTEH
jgi:hypothetical protein